MPPAKSAIFLTLTVRPGSEDDVRDALADVPALVRSVGFREPEAKLSCVTGIGAQLWGRMYDVAPPADLHPFVPLSGAKHEAPATPGDLLFHLRAYRSDLCFELAYQLSNKLRGMVDVADEVHGFRYFDDRDLLGFVDGTENPDRLLDQVAAVFVDDGSVWTGGSYVIVQKYLHDLQSWEAISTQEQERVIGRTKFADIELDDDVKPTNSHVALNTIEEADGTERQIVRDNLAFGSIAGGEFGTYFIGYAGDPDVTEQMLRNMFLGNPPGNYDRILDFSTAETGCLFFVPPAGFLEDPDEYDDRDLSVDVTSSSAGDSGTTDDQATSQDLDQSDSTRTGGSRTDGSLGIGSLRRSAQ